MPTAVKSILSCLLQTVQTYKTNSKGFVPTQILLLCYIHNILQHTVESFMYAYLYCAICLKKMMMRGTF